LNLGAPTAPPPSDVSGYLWGGVYRRDFRNGFVLVNPGSTAYSLNLGGTYRQVHASGGGTMTDSQLDAGGNYTGGTLTYQDVNSVTLTGGSAAIFLDPSNGGSLTVQDPARADANPVTGTSVGLSVLGQENGSDNGLTYTWSSSGPGGVTFSGNGSNSAKNTTATFAQAGTYTFTATISDGSNSVTSSVQVTVNQTLTSLRVSPASATVPDGGTQQFGATALDQFGNSLEAQPASTWSVDAGGLGTVNGTGLYTAPATGIGSATVRAGSGTVSAAAAVNVVVSGTATFVKADTTAQGNWQLVYGSLGYNVIGASSSYPPSVQVTPSGQSTKVWSRRTTDVRALSNPAGGRIAAAWYAANSFSVTIDVTGGQTEQVALYFLDWNKAGRSERIDVLNSAGQVVDSRTVSSFSGGQYLIWDITGDVTFRITRLAGPNAVLSGLFFDPPPP
jgi:PKD domain/Bacterial Ig-like domain (group 2)